MITPESICEEFCESLEASEVDADPLEDCAFLFPYSAPRVKEIKCRLEIRHFAALLERLRDVGYCCTQAQKDLKGGKCTAWFRPTTLA